MRIVDGQKKNAVKYYLNGFMCFLYSTLNFVTLFMLKNKRNKNLT